MSSSSFQTLQQPLPSASSLSPSSSAPSLEAAVQVAVRIRPISTRETQLQAAPLCRLDPSDPRHTVVLEPPSLRTNRRSLSPLYAEKEHDQLSFTFDFCYDDQQAAAAGGEGGVSAPDCQARVFEDIGSQIVASAIAGYNCSLLAYGQTSSGKTHSMMGSAEQDGGLGLIPRIASALFEFVNGSGLSLPSSSSVLRKVECSYVEIYSEKIRDLLDPRRHQLKVREHPKTGPYIDGVSVCAVRDYAELERLMLSGNAERTIACTNMNAESSRSHAVFTVQLTQTTVDAGSGLSSDVVSKIQLVDLAGSERVEQSGATGLRLKEASNINKSLTTLGRVVQALAQRGDTGAAAAGGISRTLGAPAARRARGRDEGSAGFIPFRDSVLTWLLKESLGGNSRTFMLACVSPADSNYEETLSTLRYASRAKNIVNRASVNEDPNAELIRRLKQEVEQLKQRLALHSSAGSSLDGQSSPSVSVAFETIREKDAELLRMNADIARLQAEAMQSRVSLLELEEQWEAKLRQAGMLQELRMQDMQDRGVSVREEAELPFLVNLNEDPALTESLLYHLHPGRTVIGSRKTAAHAAQQQQQAAEEEQQSAGQQPSDERRIVLSGLQVKADHCVITGHAAGAVISPIPGVACETHVNGQLLTEARALLHGDRVVIGQQHFLRFSRSKAAIQADRQREEERRRRREDRQSRITIDTQRDSLSPTSPLSPQSEPPPPLYDFQYAQRELMAHGDGNGLPALSLGSALNRSLNRSNVEDSEPDSSPDPTRHARSLSAHSALRPATLSASPLQLTKLSPTRGSRSPSAGQLELREEKEAEGGGEDEEEQAVRPPTFHLGRDVKGSSDWSSRRAVTKGEMDDWLQQDRRFLARHQQRVVDRAHAACRQLMQPLTQPGCGSETEYRLSSHAVYRWRLHLLRRSLRAEVMRLVFLCDEANAISAALGRPERYKVELVSSHCLLPDALQSPASPRSSSRPQSSPLQRLRGMRQVFPQVVEVRRRMLPIPVLAFDQQTFAEQLAALRQLYTEMLEGADDAAAAANTHTSTASSLSSSLSSSVSLSSSSSLSSPLAASLPSSELYSRPQLLGRAVCFLQALRYGHSVRHSCTVLDERGEVAGLLNVELEVASVDEDVARREIERDERRRQRGEREEEQRRKAREEQDRALDAQDGEDAEPEAQRAASPSALSDGEQKSGSGSSFLQSHRVLAVVLRISSFDTQTRNLRRHGLESVWVRYHVADSTAAFRSRKLHLADDCSRYAVEYEHCHYFSGLELQTLMDWLHYDGLVLEIFCRVEEQSRTQTQQTPQQTQQPAVPSSQRSSSVSLTVRPELKSNGDEDAAAAASGRRESFAMRRMQSPTQRSSLREADWQTTAGSRSSSVSVSASRRSTVSGAAAAAVPGADELALGVEIESGGGKLAEHLLFVCVDVEEEAAGGGKKGFVPCSLKQDDSGQTVYRVSMQRERRLVVSLLQADQRAFVLESLSAVTATSLSVRSALDSDAGGSGSSGPGLLSAPVSFPILEQFANVEHKLLVCTAQWSRLLSDSHPAFSRPSLAGERLTLRLKLNCFFSKSTAPVQVEVQLQLKLYRPGGDKGKGSGLFSSLRSAQPAASPADPERVARLGRHFAVTRQSSPQTVGHVFREHEIVVEQLQRRLRFEQRRQQQQLITRLQHLTLAASLLLELRQQQDSSADGLCRHFRLRFSRILADLQRRAGIRVEVEEVSSELGTKCGYLSLSLSEKGKTAGRAELTQCEPRWCVLRPPYLFVYARRGEKREQSIVRLMRAAWSRGGADADFSWQLTTAAGQRWTMQAANEAERRSWLKALQAKLSSD